jgi:hypothetical protein
MVQSAGYAPGQVLLSVDDLLIEYADALKHASDGAWGTWPVVPDHAGVRCTPHMARFNNAEHAVLALAGRPDLLESVAAFIAANADQACSACWLSAHKAKNHSECERKVRRYFDARAALAEYGERLIRAKLESRL